MVTLNPTYLKQWQEENLEHLRYQYADIKPGELILDIGSYHREWSNEMVNRYGVVAECFDALDNRAAWIKDGEIEMGGQYYYTSMYDKGEQGAVQKYKCVDIASFLQKEVSVMKINIEGGEYQLLEYVISKSLHLNIRNLQIQFHQIENWAWEAFYDHLSKLLSKTHKLTWRYPFVWENWERKEVAFQMQPSAPELIL